MVFGWGKKGGRAAPAADPGPERRVALGEVAGILDGILEVRGRTLAAEAASIRARAAPKFAELASAASALDAERLDPDEVDSRVGAIAERAKGQVVSMIREDTAAPLPEVGGVEGAEALGVRLSRSLKRIGDALGRQSRAIRIYPKKHVGRLKPLLADLEEDRKAVQALLDDHARVAGAAARIRECVSAAEDAARGSAAKSERAAQLEESGRRLAEDARRAAARADEVRGSAAYREAQGLRAELRAAGGERAALRREASDQFTKISRPLGKYEYASALDRGQRELLSALVADPFEALSEGSLAGIREILASVRRGVASGSVSVKDAEKSAQLIDETAGMLAGLASRKAAIASREEGLERRIASLDPGELAAAEAEARRIEADREDAGAKAAALAAEAAELSALAPRKAAEAGRLLRGISPVRYEVAAGSP